MKTILIAEDDQTVRNNLKFILNSNDYNVETAEDGFECLRKSHENVPDLIISDIMMPGMDGLELLEKIRNGREHSTIPFIILSAKSSYAELREGMSMGADDYLFKPFTINELLESINTALEKSERQERRLKELRDNIALTVPHEFRTPLTAILGYSEILKDEIAHTVDNDEIKEIIDNLSNSAKRFNNLVQKFTNYTNVMLLLNEEESLARIKNRTIYSSHVVISTNTLRTADRHKRLSDIEIIIEDAVLRYDETYLSFIIEELVDNAMKYSKCGSKVKVTGSSKDGRYEIKVKDFGMGMTPGQIGNIAAFNQFSKDAFNGKSGNGIGLVTVKKIAEQTGLDFKIESQPGKSTEVTITLPGTLSLIKYSN